MCESTVSSSDQQCVDMHIFAEVNVVRAIQGYHRHHQCQVDSLWQKNIFLAQSATSEFATMCESPVSISAQQCIDLHIFEEVKAVRTIQGIHRQHQCQVDSPCQKNIFLTPSPTSEFWFKMIPTFCMNRCSVCFRIQTQWQMRMTKWNSYFALLLSLWDLLCTLRSVCISQPTLSFAFKIQVCIKGFVRYAGMTPP